MRSTPLIAVVFCAFVHAQQPYRVPPKPLLDAATAKPSPSTSVDPTGRYVLLTHREAMPSIAQLSRPMLRLAGARIDPQSHGRQDTRGRRFGLSLITIVDGSTRAVQLPDDANVGSVVWSVNGDEFAFTNDTGTAIELWVGNTGSATAKRVPGVALNQTMGAAMRWMPSGNELMCMLWPGGEAPQPVSTPAGPTIQESDGKRAPVRTYQDLLQNAHDEDLFDFHFRSQLAIVNPAQGTHRKIGKPAVFASVSPAPDGRHYLVTTIARPYSYLVTMRSFPRDVEVWNSEGQTVQRVAAVPLADKVPIGGVRTGRRSIRWKPGADATLLWAEALDGGDPKTEVAHRDKVVQWDVSAGKVPSEWFRTEYRYRGMSFGERDEVALAMTYDRARRWTRTWKLAAQDATAKPEIFHERMARDSYADPGTPMTRPDATGGSRIRRAGSAMFLRGTGASPEGDYPFLDRLDIDTGAKTRLFHCGKDEYASVVAMLDDEGRKLLISRQSKTSPSNLWVVEGDEMRQLTHFEDEQAALTKGVQKRFLRYTRADGVALSGTLYTPANWDGKSRLPLLVWAYPREYVSTKTAGQVRGSQHRYTRLGGTSPLMMLLAGYAVLDGATMPIVGPKETANDTFVQQLVASARSAIEAAVDAGVADPDRCAIAGHSYGAFMTANLLAHSDLFRAGIARSGAYNRTLTPFGFQNERRTYWEAPHIYFNMSPFMHAPKIDEPILMVHGEVDNNSGTFPIQSKRLFHAIKGNGGRARLVFLPHESHGYRARESVLHVLAESVAWLDKHVKNAKPTVVPAAHEGGK